MPSPLHFAKMHFVTGKGGVGKSTYSAALASQLATQNPEAPILLIDIQGSGYSLEMVGVERFQQNPYRSLKHPNLWGCRILPFETFKEYFNVLLALGNTDTAIAQVTSALREKMVDLVVGNPAISAFVHACPGLEPAVLLGKLEYESSKGRSPTKQPWAHVVVDAPSTGHTLMLFKSTFALLEVFSQGVVFKQAKEIKSFVQNLEKFLVHLICIPEELPVLESVELKKELLSLGVQISKGILNKAPQQALTTPEEHPSASKELHQELLFEREIQQERWNFKERFLKDHSDSQILEIPEYFLPTHQEVYEACKSNIRLI